MAYKVDISLFRERLSEKIKERGLTQKKVAELCGVSEVAFSRYMTEEDRLPKTEVLANIATALHTTTDYLLGQESEVEFVEIERLIARSDNHLTYEQKGELKNLLQSIVNRLDLEA